VAIACGVLAASCAAILGFPDRELGDVGEAGPSPNEGGLESGAGDDSGGGDAAFDCGADSGLVACGAACVDPHASSANCGACGHDCLGASCDAGACEPITLATGLDTPVGIAVADDALYVAVNGANQLVSVEKLIGGTKTITFSDNPSAPWGVVLEDAGAAGLRVIVGEERGGGNARVLRCDPKDCAATTDIAGNNDEHIHYFVIDGTTLFWTEANSSNTVMKCTLGNCNNTLATVSTVEEKNAWGLTEIGSTLYWTLENSDGGVRKLPANDVATQQNLAQGIATDGTRLFWANNGGNEIRTCTPPACTATVFALSPSPAHVLVDDGIVYWSENQTAGAIAWCPTSGCGTAPRILISGQKNALWVAADKTAIYWTNSYSGGQVMKIAKPAR
jgi:hypothetical protein